MPNVQGPRSGSSEDLRLSGILTGEPVTCRCGGTMAVLAMENLHAGYGAQRRKVGTRYIYRCNRCPRRLEVRWVESHVQEAA